MQAGTNRAHVMVIGTPSLKPETPPPAGDKVAEAVLAAPKALRAGATVVEYDAEGECHVLRQGTNTLICEPDRPDEGFSVFCYHESRVPENNFQRKAAATGLERMEVFKARVAGSKRARFPCRWPARCSTRSAATTSPVRPDEDSMSGCPTAHPNRPACRQRKVRTVSG